jgi:hypothetical protein
MKDGKLLIKILLYDFMSSFLAKKLDISKRSTRYYLHAQSHPRP